MGNHPITYQLTCICLCSMVSDIALWDSNILTGAASDSSTISVSLSVRSMSTCGLCLVCRNGRKFNCNDKKKVDQLLNYLTTC